MFFSIMVYYSIFNSSSHYTVGPCYLSILYKILGWPKCSFKFFHKMLHKMNVLASSIGLHLVIPISPSIPPPHLFPSISVSHICFVRYIHLFCILDSPYKWYQMVFVFLFLNTFVDKSPPHDLRFQFYNIQHGLYIWVYVCTLSSRIKKCSWLCINPYTCLPHWNLLLKGPACLN